jgi:AcrR family transcriptional regulator
MGARVGYSSDDVVAAAIAHVNERGWHQMSMAELAERLDIKTPSLYNHVDGIRGLRRMLALHAARMLNDALVRATVGRSGDAAVRAMAHAHRKFLKSNPGLIEATVVSPPKGDRESNEAVDEIIRTCLAVLGDFGLGNERALHALRGIRSAVHGFVTLELNGGFGLPLDVDRSFEWLIDALVAGIANLAQPRKRVRSR